MHPPLGTRTSRGPPGHGGHPPRVSGWGHSRDTPPSIPSRGPCHPPNARLGVFSLFTFQQEAGSRGSSSSGGRERLISEPPLAQEKAGGPAVPSHLLGTPYSFGLPHSSVVQDSRFPPLK